MPGESMTTETLMSELAAGLLLYGLHLGSCEVEKAKAKDLMAARCTCGLAKIRGIAARHDP